MAETPLRLVKRCAEFQPQEKINLVPKGRRGLYVLYRFDKKTKRYDVVYVGLAKTGVCGRLKSHRKKKGRLWTHFSAFEVWDNIRDEEVIE